MRFRLDPRETTDEASRMAWVDEVAAATTREAVSRGLADEDVYFLTAAIREALMNALCHGRSSDGEPWVRVDVDCRSPSKLVVTVRDQGPGFDPDTVPNPVSPECCERSHGRGLFFMRRFTDRLSFAFPGPRGSLVRLEKRLPSRTD